MDSVIFRVTEFAVNLFIYCCLIFNTIKRICSIKSLMKIGKIKYCSKIKA
jgi:hypothetical protein